MPNRNTKTDGSAYLLNFKNRYVSANINMKTSKIIVNIPLKIIFRRNVEDLEFPTLVLCKHKQFCLQILQT